MGFWDVIGRVIQGKPGFEAPKGDNWDNDEPTTDFAEERETKREDARTKSLVNERGYKQPPVVAITHVKSDMNGQYLQLWATIRNQSERDIMLDKITLLGTKFELDHPLSAGDQRVFRVYNGSVIKHDHYKKAELYYKDEPTGDYFRADHLIQYRYDPDGIYDVVEFDLITPIYDV